VSTHATQIGKIVFSFLEPSGQIGYHRVGIFGG